MLKLERSIRLPHIALALVVFSPLAQAQVLFTDNLATWQAAAGSAVINTTSNYGATSTALGSGSVAYPAGTVVTIGDTWETWCCGYTGEAVWTDGAQSATLSFTGLGAFGVQVEPDLFQSETITVTLSNGQTITDTVNGDGGAQFFGFVGSGIGSLTITDGSDDDFAFGNFYSSTVANAVMISSADLVSNTVAVTLTGDTSTTGALTVTANGVSNMFSAPYNGGAAVGPGTYNVPFTRTNMPPDVYSTVTAQWNVGSAPVMAMYTLPDAWEVRGVIRHSQYNVPTESSCTGPLVTAYVTNLSCKTFTQTTFENNFVRQTQLNGTGSSNTFGLVKPIYITSCAGAKKPAGATASNTFVQVSTITGDCNSQLVPDVSVATYPDPNTSSPPNSVCGDSILLVQSSQTNLAVKSVADLCPACSGDFRGTNGHIDDFSSIPSCNPLKIPDLGNFWTADTQGQSN